MYILLCVSFVYSSESKYILIFINIWGTYSSYVCICSTWYLSYIHMYMYLLHNGTDAEVYDRSSTTKIKVHMTMRHIIVRYTTSLLYIWQYKLYHFKLLKLFWVHRTCIHTLVTKHATSGTTVKKCCSLTC